jgi:hypothetical protein
LKEVGVTWYSSFMISGVSMMNSPMDVTVSEGMPSDSEMEDTGMTSANLDFKSFNRRQADIELNTFAEGLTAAARAVFTCRSQPQYRKVCVLMLEWEDAEILQESGISELFDVFRNTFHFDVERWKIRSKASELAAFQKLDAFVESGGNKFECLKIIYYSEINRQRDEKYPAQVQVAEVQCANTSKADYKPLNPYHSYGMKYIVL